MGHWRIRVCWVIWSLWMNMHHSFPSLRSVWFVSSARSGTVNGDTTSHSHGRDQGAAITRVGFEDVCTVCVQTHRASYGWCLVFTSTFLSPILAAARSSIALTLPSWAGREPPAETHQLKCSLILASCGLPSPHISYASSLEPQCVSGLPHHIITVKRLERRELVMSTTSQFAGQNQPRTPNPPTPSSLLDQIWCVQVRAAV